MAIRKALDEDWGRIESIYNACKLDELRFERTAYVLLPLDQDNSRRAKLMESIIYVYQEPEKSVSAFMAIFENKIRSLYVLNQNRSQGIASELLEYAISTLLADQTVLLNVAKHNDPAQRLYSRFGFSIAGEFETDYNGQPATALTMKLER